MRQRHAKGDARARSVERNLPPLAVRLACGSLSSPEMESLLVQVRCRWSVTWYWNALRRVLLSIMAVLYHVTDHLQRAYFSRHYWRGILTIRISAIGFWCSGWRTKYHLQTKISCWKHRDSRIVSQVSWRRECRPRTNINCWKHPDSYKAAEVSWRSECHP